MKRVVSVFFLLCLFKLSSAQTHTPYVLTLTGDSVKITNCDSAELIIENHTQGVPGFLFNTGNGRTIFKRGAVYLNDSMYVVGGDTLRIKSRMNYIFSTGLTNNANTITSNLSTGIAGGQTAYGGINGGDALTLSSTTNASKGKIFLGQSAYDEANTLLGLGTTTPANLLDLSQTLTGSNAASALNIFSSWKTTGSPTAFKMNVTDTPSISTANIVDIQENGISRLKIPTSGARITYQFNGFNLQASNAVAGGISLGAGPVYINSIIGNLGMTIGNGTGIVAAGDGMLLSTANVSHTSGTVNDVRIIGGFAPYSGNGNFNMLNLNCALIQYNGSNGITRGLYVNPSIGAGITDFRAIEVVTGKSIFNGNISVNTSNPPTAELMIAAGTASPGTAPIKITPGTVLATPEDGTIEYDGTNYFVTQGTTRYTLSKTLTGQITTDFGAPSVAAGNIASTTLSVPGVAAGDVVSVNANSGSVNPPSIMISAYATAANTVTLRAYNAGSSTVTLASDKYTVRILK